MRGGEVELHRARGFNLRVAVELGAVVGGDRLELFGVPPHQGQGGIGVHVVRAGRRRVERASTTSLPNPRRADNLLKHDT